MSTNRLNTCFAQLKETHRKALIPYISAGDPDPEQTVAVMHALVDGGADVLELGVPFSDPAADGETIQLANERALARGVSFDDVCSMVANFRQHNDKTPIVIMGYLNSFERRGFEKAISMLKSAGADAVILVDCPIEALPDYQHILNAHDMIPILLVAPTTSEKRLKSILQVAQGFIYYVSLRGVTGKQAAQAEAIEASVASLRKKSLTPVCIGFGIRDAQTASAMGGIADGVVIGSALVAKLYHTYQHNNSLTDCAHAFVAEMRSALD